MAAGEHAASIEATLLSTNSAVSKRINRNILADIIVDVAMKGRSVEDAAVQRDIVISTLKNHISSLGLTQKGKKTFGDGADGPNWFFTHKDAAYAPSREQLEELARAASASASQLIRTAVGYGFSAQALRGRAADIFPSRAAGENANAGAGNAAGSRPPRYGVSADAASRPADVFDATAPENDWRRQLADSLNADVGYASGQGLNCLLDSILQTHYGVRRFGNEQTPQLQAIEQEAAEMRDILAAMDIAPHGEEIDIYGGAGAQLADNLGVRLQVIQRTQDRQLFQHPVLGQDGPLVRILHTPGHFKPLWPR